MSIKTNTFHINHGNWSIRIWISLSIIIKLCWPYLRTPGSFCVRKPYRGLPLIFANTKNHLERFQKTKPAFSLGDKRRYPNCHLSFPQGSNFRWPFQAFTWKILSLSVICRPGARVIFAPISLHYSKSKSYPLVLQDSPNILPTSPQIPSSHACSHPFQLAYQVILAENWWWKQFKKFWE